MICLSNPLSFFNESGLRIERIGGGVIAHIQFCQMSQMFLVNSHKK